MLSPQELELLTAHVDGELTAPQRRQVAGLLEQSGEARDMLQWLELDANRLRSLPRLTVPVDLTNDILAEIGQLAKRPVPRPRVKPAARVLPFPRWAGIAAAAAVLVAVGIASYMHNSNGRDPEGDNNPGLVVRPADNGDPRPAPHNDVIVKTRSDEAMTKNDKAIARVEMNGKDASSGTTIPKGTNNHGTDIARNDEGILGASDGPPPPRLERVELDLPTVAQLRDLDKNAAADALMARFAALKTARVELPAKDGGKAFERLRTALLARKINLHLDPATQARLKKTTGWKTDIVVFAENLTPAELVALLREVAVADREGEPRLGGAIVVKEMARLDRKNLTDLLGTDPLVNKPSPAKRKTGADIKRDLTDQTATEVAAALEGKGIPRPGAEMIHHAYVGHLLAAKTPPSAELKRFLELRQPARPGTLAVFIVLRSIG